MNKQFKLPKNYKASKPSDFPLFCMSVYAASATQMSYEAYMTFYGELLQLLFWNPEIDTPLAIGGEDGKALLSETAKKYTAENGLLSTFNDEELKVMQNRLDKEKN